MAIYRLSIQLITRGQGRCATAAAAYRAAECIRDERTGLTFDYGRRGGVIWNAILAPDRTPDWMYDREQLWNAVERAEKRRDSQLAREVQLALPHELSADDRVALVREFVEREFVQRGMIADIAIHAPHRDGDARNCHAHVLLTLRELASDGFGKKERSWNDRELLGSWREAWAEHANRALERAGRLERVDHRSLEAQGMERGPEVKLGPAVVALERRERREAKAEGREPQPRERLTDRGALWVEVTRENAARRLAAALQRLHDRVADVLARQRERLDSAWTRVAESFERALDVLRTQSWREDVTSERDHSSAAPEPSRQGSGRQDNVRDAEKPNVDRLLGREAREPTTRGSERAPSVARLLGRDERASVQTGVDRDALLGRRERVPRKQYRTRDGADRDR